MYDVINVAGKEILVKQDKNNINNYVSVVTYEELFNVLYETHINVGHGGRDKMIHALKTKYDITRYAIEKLLETCEVCQKKKK